MSEQFGAFSGSPGLPGARPLPLCPSGSIPREARLYPPHSQPAPVPGYFQRLLDALKAKLSSHVSDVNDPHRTLGRVPIVYTGSVAPSPSPHYKDTDVYVNVATGGMYVMAGGSWTKVKPAVKGDARALPEYLHELSFDDVYRADAEAWYAGASPAPLGACTAARRGGLLGRNYDWKCDEAAEFVVRVSGTEDRHASVGVASLGSALTERAVESGLPNALYRVLPGMTLDGINDAGLVAEINVIPRDPAKDPVEGGVRTLHPLALVREALDSYATAAEAAEALAARYYIPAGYTMSFHWTIADASSTWVVEDGEAHEAGSSAFAMTNHRLCSEDGFGTGYARREAAASAPDVASALAAARFTNAYAAGWPWPDEFAGKSDALGPIPHGEAARLRAWADAHVTPHLDPVTRKPRARDGVLWQTVHSSVYDFTAKTMKVAVQESDEFFTFAVVRGGDMKHAEFADLDEREGMTLKEVGAMVNTLVRKLKGTVAALVAAFALGAFAEVTPDTDFGDVDPFAKLGAVLESGGALPDDAGKLGTNANFRAAVAAVSPPVVLPTKWALSNVTNAQGQAVGAGDVGAVPTTRKINGQALTQDITIQGMPDAISASVVTNTDGIAGDRLIVRRSVSYDKNWDFHDGYFYTMNLGCDGWHYFWSWSPEYGTQTLEDYITSRTSATDSNFSNAVVRVSPPVDLSSKLDARYDNDSYGVHRGAWWGEWGQLNVGDNPDSQLFSGYIALWFDSLEWVDWEKNHYYYRFPQSSGTIALQSWQSLSTMLTDAGTNQTARTTGVADKIVNLTAVATTNAVLAVRDRFYDEELDVTWKRTVSGGRIYYDIEAVGNSTED